MWAVDVPREENGADQSDSRDPSLGLLLFPSPDPHGELDAVNWEQGGGWGASVTSWGEAVGKVPQCQKIDSWLRNSQRWTFWKSLGRV